jgi:hypothetical protein
MDASMPRYDKAYILSLASIEYALPAALETDEVQSTMSDFVTAAQLPPVNLQPFTDAEIDARTNGQWLLPARTAGGKGKR